MWRCAQVKHLPRRHPSHQYIYESFELEQKSHEETRTRTLRTRESESQSYNIGNKI